MIIKYDILDIKSIKIDIKKWDIIFLNWDLWAWKTTLAKHIINNILSIDENITSPTYTYYNKYNNIYHFDLYRINSYDEFFSIWWEDILDNPDNISIIEWPDIIKDYYKPTIEINIKKTNDDNKRELEINFFR